MKQKKYFILAAAAILMAACSENDVVEKQKAPQTANDGAVVFDAYQSRGTTRAGLTGTMDLNQLQKPADEGGGFGVFSYYTNNEGYSELAKPDFMYNQGVFHVGSSWTYEPIKYWPNEFGTEASSERVDYLTFFAYAPYVKADEKTGKVAETSTETGIIGMTRNTTIGDPLIKYAIDFDPDNCVDLCWGVAANDFSETVTTTDPKNDIKKGKPFIDVIKPLTGSKIKFDFKHALTQLNIQIDTDVDVASHGGSDADSKTRIFVRSVTFEGFTDKGTLNLNSDYTVSETPIWYDITGNGNLSTNAISVYDGRYDGREGVANVVAPNELPQGLNKSIIQDNAYEVSGVDLVTTTTGVKHDPVNLFAAATLDAPIMVIPNKQPMKVKVVYDVETYDPSLSTFLSDGKTHGSTIENAISQDIKLASGDAMILESGKKFTIKLHLGLTSVKFDAEVSSWTPYSGGEANTDLPTNVPTASAAKESTIDINIPAAGATGTFLATGFTSEGAVTASITLGSITTSPVPTSASTAGNVTVEYSIPENNKITQKTGALTVTETSDSKSATLSFTQAAAALGLKINSAPVAITRDIVLGATAAIETNEFKNAAWTVVRNRNGVTKTLAKADTPSTDQYKVTENSGDPITVTVTLGEDALAGDVYTITVQAGHAAAETVSFTVAKQNATIAFADPTPTDPSTFTAGNYALGKVVMTNVAKLWNSAPTPVDITSTGGDITYTLSDNEYFSITDDGVLKFKAGWNPGDSRAVTVTATVTPSANYTYTPTSVSYNITVETANP